MPSGFKEESKMVTKVTGFKQLIETKMQQLKDMATLEVMMPVSARLANRMKSIKKRYSAVNMRIRMNERDRGFWKTTKPELHIRNLEGRKIDNKHAEIEFEVYEMDEKGNKKAYSKKAKVQLSDGSTEERLVTADYRIAYKVTETIKYGKAITREILKFETGAEE